MGSKRMGKRLATPASVVERPRGIPTAVSKAAGEGWQRIALGAAVCLVLTRVLYPSESAAASGDGAPIILLWTLLAPALGLISANYNISLTRLGFFDGAFVIWSGAMAASALWGGGHGVTRQGLNMAFEWVAFAIAFTILRLLIRTDRERRSAILVLLAVAVGQCLLALFQVLVEKPRTLRFFENNPDQALFEAGVYAPQGSPLRYLFEQRLRSPEPEGSFALTNNLAGFLAPLLVVTFGAIMYVWLSDVQAGRRSGFAGKLNELRKQPGVLFPLIAWVLLLTRSRGGYAAAGLGVLGTLVIHGFRGADRKRLQIFAGYTAWGVLLLIASGAALGVFNAELFATAIKSLSFRWDYWRASMAMWAANPIAGCGSGLFQRAYTQYKLPWASETVADPHNFMVEIAATGGAIGLVTFLVFCASLIRAMLVGSPATEPNSADGRPPADASKAILVGGAASFLLTWFISPLASVQFDGVRYVTGLLISAGCGFYFSDWVDQGRLPRAAILMAICAALVHMTVSSGVSTASVIGPVWLLVAIVAPTNNGRSPYVHARTGYFFATLTLPLFILCYVYMFYPNTACQSEIKKTHLAIFAEKAEEAEARIRRAIDADPWNSEAALLMADVSFQAWRRSPSKESLARFEFDQNLALNRCGPLSSAYLQAGTRNLAIFRVARDEAYLRRSEEFLKIAQRLYPNDALTNSELAWVLDIRGDKEGGKRFAQRALSIDRSHNHVEQKLSRARLSDPSLPPGHSLLAAISAIAGEAASSIPPQGGRSQLQ